MALSISLANDSSLAHYYYSIWLTIDNSISRGKLFEEFETGQTRFIVHCSSCKIFFMTFQIESAAANVLSRFQIIIKQDHLTPSLSMCPFTSLFFPLSTMVEHLTCCKFFNFAVLLEEVSLLLHRLRFIMQRTSLMEYSTKQLKKKKEKDNPKSLFSM